MSVHDQPDDGRYFLVMKGAPERILERCGTYYHNGMDMPIDNRFKDAYEKAYNYLGGLGERVLGMFRE